MTDTMKDENVLSADERQSIGYYSANGLSRSNSVTKLQSEDPADILMQRRIVDLEKGFKNLDHLTDDIDYDIETLENVTGKLRTSFGNVQEDIQAMRDEVMSLFDRLDGIADNMNPKKKKRFGGLGSGLGGGFYTSGRRSFLGSRQMLNSRSQSDLRRSSHALDRESEYRTSNYSLDKESDTRRSNYSLDRESDARRSNYSLDKEESEMRRSNYSLDKESDTRRSNYSLDKEESEMRRSNYSLDKEEAEIIRSNLSLDRESERRRSNYSLDEEEAETRRSYYSSDEEYIAQAKPARKRNPDLSPDMTPDMTPRTRTPDLSPERTPNMTPSYSPAYSPASSPPLSPARSRENILADKEYSSDIGSDY